MARDGTPLLRLRLRLRLRIQHLTHLLRQHPLSSSSSLLSLLAVGFFFTLSLCAPELARHCCMLAARESGRRACPPASAADTVREGEKWQEDERVSHTA